MKLNHNIDTLVIESTRRCTQMCDHCLRGDAQDCEMSGHILEKLFEQLDAAQIDYIDNITFSGGEPLMNPDIIDETVNFLEKYSINCGNFYIATGAHAIPMTQVKKAIASVARLYAYCDENECSAINISNDYYHVNDENIVRMLKAFSFTSEKHGEHFDDKYLIAEGRLDGNSNYHRKAPLFDLPDEDYPRYSIYFNCKGDLIPGCDFSYEHQDQIARHNVVQSDEAVEDYIKYIQSLMKKAREKQLKKMENNC